MNFLDKISQLKKQELITLAPKRQQLLDLAQQKKTVSFSDALSTNRLALIAEIKRSSPSKGRLANINDVAVLAKSYCQQGAAAISVLTEPHYFSGSFDDLKTVADANKNIALLCKDFIIDELQLLQARANGAAAVLLIVALVKERLAFLLAKAKDLGLDVLVEVHDLPELKAAVKVGAQIIGINNRNLKTLAVDQNIALTLRKEIPPSILAVAESGINTVKQYQAVQEANFDAVLIGEAMVKKKTQLKICGITTVEDALYCAHQGVDFLGLNFSKNSKRQVTLEQAMAIEQAVKDFPIELVAIFVEQSNEEIIHVLNHTDIKQVQLHSLSTQNNAHSLPAAIKRLYVCFVNVAGELSNQATLAEKGFMPGRDSLLFDGMQPGQGQMINLKKVEMTKPSYSFGVAGGVSAANALILSQRSGCDFLDVCSAVEKKPGKKDHEKISEIHAILQQGVYDAITG